MPQKNSFVFIFILWKSCAWSPLLFLLVFASFTTLMVNICTKSWIIRLVTLSLQRRKTCCLYRPCPFTGSTQRTEWKKLPMILKRICPDSNLIRTRVIRCWHRRRFNSSMFSSDRNFGMKVSVDNGTSKNCTHFRSFIWFITWTTLNGPVGTRTRPKAILPNKSISKTSVRHTWAQIGLQIACPQHQQHWPAREDQAIPTRFFYAAV